MVVAVPVRPPPDVVAGCWTVRWWSFEARAVHSPKSRELTTGADYSPRHSPLRGEWAEQPPPGPAPCSAGFSHWPHPARPFCPRPEGAKGGAKGVALVRGGVSRSPWSGCAFRVVSGQTSSSAALGPGGGGVDGWGRWRPSEPAGAALAVGGSRRPVAAAATLRGPRAAPGPLAAGPYGIGLLGS